MASNKWLSDLKTLKSTTNTLRNILRNKNVSALDTDPLPTLVGKVPNLAPIEISEEYKDWEPDPKWVFPDPNGSGEMKTIRQIYDEDTMASSYTYRGIYLIYGDVDVMDLKSALSKSTSSFTFVLSDGTTYNNITANTLVHTWNREHDVFDSKNRRVRYVKIYGNTGLTILPGFYRQLIWAIHNLGTSVTSSGSDYTSTISTLLYERLEIETKVTGQVNLSSVGYPRSYVNKPIKAIGNILTNPQYQRRLEWLDVGDATGSWNLVYSYLTNVRRITVPENIDSLVMNLAINGNLERLIWAGTPKVKTLTLSNTVYYSSGSSSIMQPYNQRFYLEVPESVTTLSVECLWQDALSLPKGLKSCTIKQGQISSLILPEGLTSLTLDTMSALKELVIPSTVTSITLTAMWNLSSIIVPNEFDVAANFTAAYQLTHDSIVGILNNLKDLTGLTAKKLTLGSTHLSKLSDDEKLIATNKNWTLA